MLFHMTPVSGNKKVGPMPVSTTSAESCPPSCAFYGQGCYADYGPLKIHWNKVSKGERGDSFGDFVDTIKRLPKRTVWRMNQAGDLPGVGEEIDADKLMQVSDANKGKTCFTYTHKNVLTNQANREALVAAVGDHFVVNLSANNVNHADELMELGIAPVVVVVAEDAPKVSYTPKGARIVACPADTEKNITCLRCKLCAVRDRDYLIGFRAHGSGKKKVAKISQGQ